MGQSITMLKRETRYRPSQSCYLSRTDRINSIRSFSIPFEAWSNQGPLTYKVKSPHYRDVGCWSKRTRWGWNPEKERYNEVVWKSSYIDQMADLAVSARCLYECNNSHHLDGHGNLWSDSRDQGPNKWGESSSFTLLLVQPLYEESPARKADRGSKHLYSSGRGSGLFNGLEFIPR